MHFIMHLGVGFKSIVKDCGQVGSVDESMHIVPFGAIEYSIWFGKDVLTIFCESLVIVVPSSFK